MRVATCLAFLASVAAACGGTTGTEATLPDLPADQSDLAVAEDANVCTPDCAGKQCGDDGCGGSCGTCLPGIACNSGLCNGCDDGNAVDWDGCTKGAITEFQVNAYWVGWQNTPTVAVLKSGAFAFAWTYSASGAASLDVHTRLFGADGTSKGVETLVPASAVGAQSSPDIVALPNGGYVVLWNADGANGKDDIFAQRYLATGEKDGATFTASPDSPDDDQSARASLLASGELLVLFLMEGDGGTKATYAQRLTIGGAPVGLKILVCGSAYGNYAAQALPGGGFLAAWKYDYSPVGINGAVFDKDGVQQGASVNLAAPPPAPLGGTCGLPRLALLASGELLLAWYANDGDQSGAYARRLTQAGAPIGSMFLANTTTKGSQGNPVPIALPDGRFVVAWSGYGSPDPTDSSVYFQRHLADGTKVGSETMVNTYTSGNQTIADGAAFPDGSFLIVFNSEKQDGSDWGIFAQRFSANGEKLYR